MNENLISLSKLFSERIFRIPDYQRGYSWTEKEIEAFWEDLERLPEGKNHYLGVLTLEEVEKKIYKTWIDDLWLIDSKCYKPYFIVDGQQRLTTAILLICAILNEVNNHEPNKGLNYTPIRDIYRKFICEEKEVNKSESYIFCYDYSNPSRFFLVNEVLQKDTNVNSPENETIYTTNLSFALNYFSEKLNSKNREEIEKLYIKLTQRLLLNIYSMSSEIDVYVAFETMNNRGKKLSNLELLKNRLIYLSTLLDADSDIKERLRRDINECWKTIYHYLGKTKEVPLSDDEFLDAHSRIYLSEEKVDIVCGIEGLCWYEEFVDYYTYGLDQEFYLDNYFTPANISNGLTVAEIFEYIRSLEKSIQSWCMIKNPRESNGKNRKMLELISGISLLNQRIFRYTKRRYVHNENVEILLLLVLNYEKNTTLINNFLKSLERYLFVNRLYLEKENEEEVLDFLQLIKIAKQRNIVLMTEKILKATAQLETTANFDKICNYYQKEGFYKTQFPLAYFLHYYELFLLNQSKSKKIKVAEEFIFDEMFDSVEHIYPTKSQNEYWTNQFLNFDARKKKTLKNSLGNLVLLGNEKNSKLGNKSFKDKIGTNQNSVGYKYGTYSEIELTNYADWGAEEILDRGLKLLTFLQERWGVKIGNGKREDKKKFLGLSFLK